MTYRCYTCGLEREAQDVARCTRPYCTTKRELAKDEEAAKRERWAREDNEKHVHGTYGHTPVIDWDCL